MKGRYLIGVDEAGRGPLAGPVSVAAVSARVGNVKRLTSNTSNKNGLPRLRDSKQLSESQRERWFQFLKNEKRAGRIDYASALVGNRTIDRRGIVRAVKLAMSRALRRLRGVAPARCLVLLDGGLTAPRAFQNQRTIIGGDRREPLIMLASIIAKVRRDRQMIRQARRFPAYDFAAHKGYGTAVHYRALRRHGLSPIHRLSYLTNHPVPRKTRDTPP